MSENYLEILGEQSDTVDTVGNTNSTDDQRGGTEASDKKAKIMMTEKEQSFESLFIKVNDKMSRHVGKTRWNTNDVPHQSVTYCSQ